MARFSDRPLCAALTAGSLTAACLGLLLAAALQQTPPAEVQARTDQLGECIRSLNDRSAYLEDFRAALNDLSRCVSVAEALADLRLRYPNLTLPHLSAERLEYAHGASERLAWDDKAKLLLQGQEERYRRAVDFATSEDVRLASR